MDVTGVVGEVSDGVFGEFGKASDGAVGDRKAHRIDRAEGIADYVFVTSESSLITGLGTRTPPVVVVPEVKEKLYIYKKPFASRFPPFGNGGKEIIEGARVLHSARQ